MLWYIKNKFKNQELKINPNYKSRLFDVRLSLGSYETIRESRNIRVELKYRGIYRDQNKSIQLHLFTLSYTTPFFLDLTSLQHF